MIITDKNFDHFILTITKDLKEHPYCAFDTETTTLNYFESKYIPVSPNIFSIQFKTKHNIFYLDTRQFNYTNYVILSNEVFSMSDVTFFAHNAKFDLKHLKNKHVEIKGNVHCTQSIERLIDNLLQSYSLDSVAQKYLDAKKVVLENVPQTKVKKWGVSQAEITLLHYDKIPINIMYDYATYDVELCYQIGIKQISELDRLNREYYYNMGTQNIFDLYTKECEITKILADIEFKGIRFDKNYCKAAYFDAIKNYKELETTIKAVALSHGITELNINAPKSLAPLFKILGVEYNFTEKGNMSFDSDALKRSTNAVAKMVLDYRYHYKRAHTYFENYVQASDVLGYMHFEYNQGGTKTGRMSGYNPNMQNMPKRSEDEASQYPLRGCFLPDPDCVFVEIDYNAAEYRLMVDYANEERLANAINNGEDVHEATAKLLGVSRSDAKTINFGLLYGMGVKTLASKLKISDDKAYNFRKEYFRKLPQISKLLNNVSNRAKSVGYVITWSGRKINIPYNECYKASNSLIQGGVGDIGKQAMIMTSLVLKNTQSRLVLNTHDALLFCVHTSELGLIPKLKESMENVYNAKIVPMKTSIAIGEKTLHDLN